MNTKITLDLGKPQLLQLLRFESAKTGTSMKDLIVKAIEAYFVGEQEYQAMLRAAEQSFASWNNAKDAAYDQL